MNKTPQVARDTTLTTTEARQASPRRSTLRILVTSMALLAVIGAVTLAVFWTATPESVPVATEPPAAIGTPATGPDATAPPATP